MDVEAEVTDEEEEEEESEEEEEESITETSQANVEQEASEPENPRRKDHQVNYITAIVTCTNCIASGTWEDLEDTECEVCGPEKVFKCGEWELDDGDVVGEFLDFMLYALPKDYTTYAYAHNGGKYDNHFLLQELYNRPKLKPSFSCAGHKLFQVSVRKTKRNNAVVLRDSCLMFPMRLDEAPKAFKLRRANGQEITPKMHFPYLFNREENYGNPILGLPPAEDYILSKFSAAELPEFLEWHKEEDRRRREQGIYFELEKELEEYCFNDAEILMFAVLRFREIYNEQAGGDLFIECCTISSGCLKMWKTKYLKDHTVGIVPNHGYGRYERQSAKALKYLKWFAWAHNIDVQHRDSDKGEKKTIRYRLDGYIKPRAWDNPGFTECNVTGCPYCTRRPDGPVALEFNGCAYHGCPFDCFPTDTKLPTGKMSDEQWGLTEWRRINIESLGYFYINVQECQLDKELKTNKIMKDFMDYCVDTGHIDPRDGFFGGRVGPMRMYCTPKADEEIKFFDIVSLYPHVLRKEFPVGHPEIIRDFDEHHWTEDNWEQIYSKKYKGVFKVLVVPPTADTIPVLPMRDNGRLLFPLCRTCAIDSRKADPFREPGCGHHLMERAFVTTTTHVELDLAIKAGYEVIRVIEVWHYKKWDSTIFEGYITDFMRLKEEATGWGSIKDIEDPVERENAKNTFIADYFEKTGVQLRKDFVEDIPALRAVMKLFLNCLWGRLGMRPNKTHYELMTSPNKLYKLLGCPTKIVESIDYINEDTMKVGWKYVNRCDPEDNSTNVVYAMFTTSYGRAEIYRHMCNVEETMDGPPGSRFLYGDTDSIIFLQKKNNPAMTPGRYLGEMKDEYPGHEILEYICGGNKQYGLKLRHLKEGYITTKQKIRGITLNSTTSQLLSYEKMKEMVLGQLSPDSREELRLPYDLIRRDKYSNVFTLKSEKIYRTIFKKGWIDRNLRIWPHGYIPEEENFMAKTAPTRTADVYLASKL